MIPEKEKALLAIPAICADQIITMYHSSLFAGHQGVIKTYLTIADKFFIPDLMYYLCSDTKGCHICQFSKKDMKAVTYVNFLKRTSIPNKNKLEL